MNAPIDEFLVALARDSAAAAVLVVLVLATQWLFRRQLAPRWQGALWLVVLVRLLPLSVTSETSIFNLLPPWNVPPVSFHATAKPLDVTNPSPAAMATVADAPIASIAAIAPDLEPGVELEPRNFLAGWSWSTVVFLVWLSGVLLLVGYVMITALALSRSLRGRQPIDDPAVRATLADCCVRMGIRRAPVLIDCGIIRTPALHGLIRPRLLLPPGFAKRYSSEERRFIFLHELAHLRRHDLLLNWVVTVLQIVHWFNPLVWFGFARWRVDREIACDAMALEAAGGQSNRAYGHTILRLLENFSYPNSRIGLVGILEDKRQLRRRLEMITHFTPNRRPFLVAGLITVLSLLGLTDAQMTPATGSATTARRQQTSSSAVPTALNSSSAVTVDVGAPSQPVGAPTAEHPARRRTDVARLQSSLPATATTVTVRPPTNRPVVFLLNSSESMLADLDVPQQPGATQTADSRFFERGRTYTANQYSGSDDEKRAAPKWLRGIQALEQMLNELPADTAFQVALYSDDRVEIAGSRTDPNDRQAIASSLARVRQVIPQGLANLESAFNVVADTFEASPPQRVVLITDGLPTTSASQPSTHLVSQSSRIQAFESATKRLPPRVPIHTVLLSTLPGDPAAAGLYWTLAHATRGGLTVPARTGIEPRTHLAFVIDSSGSMRNPKNGGLWPIVISTIESTLDAHPHLTGVQVLDGDGRFLLARRGNGLAAWAANTAETRSTIKDILRGYAQDTVSNPIPGVLNAIRFLYDKSAPEMRMGIYLLGDEFNSSDPAGLVLDRIDSLNPRDGSGRRAIMINAIGFPTTIRTRFSMGNTGLRFANLMRLLTYDHDGGFVALPEL